jgi:ABC-type amino acid transport substrate-binding protein
MRKKLALLLAGVMALTLPVTGASTASAAEDTSKLNLMKSGSLVVCMTLQFVPQMHLNARGKPTGYDYELLRKLAKDLGLKLEIRNTDFNGLLAGIASKQCDMTSVGLRRTAARELSMTYAGEYMPYGTVLAAPRGSKRAETIAAWNVAGTKITCLKGSVECAAIKDNFPNATVSEFPTQDGAILEAASGRADGAVMATPVFAGYSKNNPGVMKLVNFGKPLGEYWGNWTVQLGNAALAKRLQTWLCDAVESNFLQRTYRRAMGSPIAAVPVCPA